MTFVKRYPRALVRANPAGEGEQVVILYRETDRNSSSQFMTPYPGRAQELALSATILQRHLWDTVVEQECAYFDSDSSQDEECIDCGKTREEHR